MIEGVKIFIKRSKTDQSGEGSIKAIPYFNNNEFCPVRALKEYIKDIEEESVDIKNLKEKLQKVSEYIKRQSGKSRLYGVN